MASSPYVNLLLCGGSALFLLLGSTDGFAPIIPSTSTRSSHHHHDVFQQPHWQPSQSKNLQLLCPRSTISQSTRSTATSALFAAATQFFIFDEDTTQKLILLAFEKAIEIGVPTLFFVITTWWIISMMRRRDEDEYEYDGGMGRRGSRGSRRQRGSGGKRRRGGERGAGGGMFGLNRSLGPVEELYDDIYDDLSGPEQNNNIPPIIKLLTGSGSGDNSGRGGMMFDRPTSKLNIGIPKKQYLKVTKLNSIYDSYRYSMIKATKGKAIAAAELRSRGFESALWKALGISNDDDGNGLGKLSQSEATELITLERDFLSEGCELLDEVATLNREIVNAAVLDEMEEMGVEPGVIDAEIIVAADEEEKKDGGYVLTDAQKEFFGIATTATSISATTTAENEKSSSSKKKHKKSAGAGLQSDIMKAVKAVEAINTQITLLELEFIQSIVEILGPNRADTIRTTVVGNIISGEVGTLLKTLKERPLAAVLSTLMNGDGSRSTSGVEANTGKNLYVTRFPGDVTASQLNELREEVTGILQVAKPGDEALLVLQSGGGTVTGYGLAAAQLQRFKAKNIKLTVCVEQVAASGGYMMCCTADRIVASPFAVLGSIGVISEVPNAYERLLREGIEFQTITAGKYKRTITPTKKVTKEDLKKSTEDINEIFNLFKSFVASQRPQLDIENVATGDTWFGEDALARGLCDELATVDDVLLDFVEKGYDLYEVAYDPTPEEVGLLSLLRRNRADANKAGMNGWRGVLRSMVRGIVSDVKEEVLSELSTSMNEMNSVEKRYMAMDDSADRIKAQETNESPF